MPEGLAGWVIGALVTALGILATVIKVIFDRYTASMEKRLEDKDKMIDRLHEALDRATKADLEGVGETRAQNELLRAFIDKAHT